eukprot:327199-Hanusia_phi.AAC.7
MENDPEGLCQPTDSFSEMNGCELSDVKFESALLTPERSIKAWAHPYEEHFHTCKFLDFNQFVAVDFACTNTPSALQTSSNLSTASVVEQVADPYCSSGGSDLEEEQDVPVPSRTSVSKSDVRGARGPLSMSNFNQRSETRGGSDGPVELKGRENVGTTMTMINQWRSSSHKGLLTCTQGKKRWYQCSMCSYTTDRLFHTKRHYDRIHVNNGKSAPSKRKYHEAVGNALPGLVQLDPITVAGHGASTTSVAGVSVGKTQDSAVVEVKVQDEQAESACMNEKKKSRMTKLRPGLTVIKSSKMIQSLMVKEEVDESEWEAVANSYNQFQVLATCEDLSWNFHSEL